MSMSVESVSAPARVAELGEGITVDELRLAARNHGMPLEALHYDVTPVGLHYLLTHYDIPVIDPAAWRLAVDGAVPRPLSLSLDDLRAREPVTHRVTLECAGNGRARLEPRPVSQPWLDEAVGTASWTGARLADVLGEAGLRDGARLLDAAVDVAFTGADRGVERGEEQVYRRGLPVAEALRDDVLLAYEMNGQPLPPQHGAPVRLVVPGWYGMAHVKWLVGVTVLDAPFDGFQNVTAYRVKREPDEPGEPVTRILPRALIRPPGIPDFQSRVRIVDRGRVVLTGRAWSGWAPVLGVDVSADGGGSWAAAELGPQPDTYAWRPWRFTWEAPEPGRYALRARARDGAGHVQPVEAAWNRQGMANNHAQLVDVVVR
ncbi:sulfite oxidase [Jiangella gansuensis]|uniref:sulfite oxidase n=1 Tax=Jiangella gansuensis TaxID=281473 RepID=UPI000479B8DE|nr:sulfite oxidase [Jiangella gansuensis]